MAGIGASGALLAASLLVFLGAVVGVSFDTWPAPAGPGHNEEVVTVSPNEGPAVTDSNRTTIASRTPSLVSGPGSPVSSGAAPNPSPNPSPTPVPVRAA